MKGTDCVLAGKLPYYMCSLINRNSKGQLRSMITLFVLHVDTNGITSMGIAFVGLEYVNEAIAQLILSTSLFRLIYTIDVY